VSELAEVLSEAASYVEDAVADVFEAAEDFRVGGVAAEGEVEEAELADAGVWVDVTEFVALGGGCGVSGVSLRVGEGRRDVQTG
jgi:hypothetical protein